MAHDYPRFGADHPIASHLPEVIKAHPVCECCDKPVTHSVYVQTGAMRGDDEVYFVCPVHVGMARRTNRFKKFLALAMRRPSE